jgi:hypothetical protein
MPSDRLKAFLDSLALARSLGGQFRVAALGIALQTAREMEDPRQRSRALLLLHLDLDEPMKTRALRESLEAALQIRDVSARQDVLRLITKQLVRVKLTNIQKAWIDDVAMVVRAGDLRPEGSIARQFLRETAGRRGRFLGDIAPKLEAEEIPRYFDLARGLPDPAGRAFALTGLVSRLSVDERDEAFRMALEATRGIRFPHSRSSLIRRIGPDLPEEMLGEAFEITLGLPQNLRSGALSALAPRLDVGQLEIAGRVAEEAPRSLYLSAPVLRRSSAPDPVRLALTSWFETQDSGAELSSRKSEPARVVSTGFSVPEDPERPFARDRPLLVLQWYLFWLEVGEPVTGAIDEGASTLPADLLPPDAELQVVLFSNEADFEIDSLGRSGVLRVRGKDSAVEVVKPAAIPDSLPADAAVLRRRLFFRVRTPEVAGRYQLRCNIYHQQVLVQGRKVNVLVNGSSDQIPEALVTTLDYSLSRSLAASHLGEIQEHRLSLMTNADGEGSHGFYFHGVRDFNRSARFDGHQVQSLIDRVRKVLRTVSWGSEEQWNSAEHEYRYTERAMFDGFFQDLHQLAKAGYLNYDAIINQLSGGREGAEGLAQLMRRPGLLQLALRESARLVLPIALLYDHPLDTQLPMDKVRLCPQFMRSSSSDSPLEEQVCFLGDCPHREEVDVICPSGFWGFRHSIGVPLTIGGELDSPPDSPGELPYHGFPDMTLAVCTDEQMQERVTHVNGLKSLIPPERLHYADTRESTLKCMRDVKSHLIYFYCHGGRKDGVPFLQVGPLDDPGIARDTLRWSKIRWSYPRPLVFINGCNTTDLEPENAIELVSGFIETAGASGVVGTEITVFEPLAVTFGEHFLSRFLTGGSSLGEAIRSARLLLLKDLNPLGLVYIPFGLASLRLMEAKSTVEPMAQSA